MIAGLRGTVEGVSGDGLLVAVGGVVFQVAVPASVLACAPTAGQSVFLHTYLHVREDNVALFGFSSQRELALFRTLLGVSGVGPRLALAMLSSLGVERLTAAINQQQTEVLSGVPGVGKRTAARVILELRGKLVPESDGQAAPAAPGVASQTLAALASLGYSAAEAHEAWRHVPEAERNDVERALRACLGYLADRA